MKKVFFASRLISSILIVMVLLYFMTKTTSPKIVFVPFLISGISMAGLNAARMLDRENYAILFHKLFISGLLLFWFGFLILGSYITVRDKQFSIMIFLLPFWLVGIGIAKKFF